LTMSFKLSPEYALLGVLMAGPKHGYEVYHFFSSNMEQFWRLSMSQIYALLKRMEKDGVVISKEEHQDNRPAKKIFFITSSGKERLLDWVFSPVNHVRNLRIEFMAKLFFIHELNLSGVSTIIHRQMMILEEKLRLMRRSQEKRMDEFQKVLHSFKIAQTIAAMNWLRECKTIFSHNQ
jgi:PadR family transcriptional regulator AphA